MNYQYVFGGIIFLFLASCGNAVDEDKGVLHFEEYVHYFNSFNSGDEELYRQYIPNEKAIAFLDSTIPLLDLPDKTIEETYYFRWWTFRKHIRKIPDGFVITEFLPDVPWAGKYNTINCPAAYHFYEGRWLRDPEYLDAYLTYWLTEADNLRRYSFWVADASRAFFAVHPDVANLSGRLPAFIDNYYAWERERRDGSDRLFWQEDNLDGMEFSTGGRAINQGVERAGTIACRPTINSYMYADARAIAAFAFLLGEDEQEQEFSAKANEIRELVNNRLWNDSLAFYTLLPRDYRASSQPVDIRELIGYTPWYFNMPPDSPEFGAAWTKVLDTTGFAAPFGLTTVERSHPYFKISYEGHECQWNGPSWPFATTQVLKGLSNFLNNYAHKGELSGDSFYNLLHQYAASHTITLDSGEERMWIDENLNPFTGEWIARTRLKSWENGSWSDAKGGKERGKDYNHSGFCDLVISDLIGVKPELNGSLTIAPLTPASWNWFCLDRVPFRGSTLTILYDKDGTRYGKGRGFKVYVNGKLMHQSPRPQTVTFHEIGS